MLYVKRTKTAGQPVQLTQSLPQLALPAGGMPVTTLFQTALSPKQRLIRPSHHMRRTRGNRLIASGADIALISPAHITHSKLRSPRPTLRARQGS